MTWHKPAHRKPAEGDWVTVRATINRKDVEGDGCYLGGGNWHVRDGVFLCTLIDQDISAWSDGAGGAGHEAGQGGRFCPFGADRPPCSELCMLRVDGGCALASVNRAIGDDPARSVSERKEDSK